MIITIPNDKNEIVNFVNEILSYDDTVDAFFTQAGRNILCVYFEQHTGMEREKEDILNDISSIGTPDMPNYFLMDDRSSNLVSPDTSKITLSIKESLMRSLIQCFELGSYDLF